MEGILGLESLGIFQILLTADIYGNWLLGSSHATKNTPLYNCSLESSLDDSASNRDKQLYSVFVWISP